MTQFQIGRHKGSRRQFAINWKWGIRTHNNAINGPLSDDFSESKRLAHCSLNSGFEVETIDMPRYVVLTHDHPHPHWDFMLEQGGTLRSWRLLQEPLSGMVISAVSLPNHRKHYLDYEGPISNNRGEVQRWDRGEFACIEESDEHLTVQLDGQRLCGKAVLARDAATIFP